jgi:hypothetical protein
VHPFLPFTDFMETAQSLETRRLGKRRVETLQIVRALTCPGYTRRNHPVMRMWRGDGPPARQSRTVPSAAASG